MLSQRGYLNQVTLIESECEPRKKPITIPATVFNRSPIRDRQNKLNLSNLGNMGGTPTRSGSKLALSPLRARKCETSISVKSTMSKRLEVECTNHRNKVAKYLVESDEETMFYCEKCAILLASQGFKVSKMGESNILDNPRRKEVDDFLDQLDGLMGNMMKKQGSLTGIVNKGMAEYQGEIQKIQTYYSQFYELIDEHKRRVLEEMKLQYDTASHSIVQMSHGLNQAVNESNSMKEDITASLNSIIMEAEQSEYRPVMDLYKEKVRKYRAVLNKPIPQQEIEVRRVGFKDGEELCHIIAEGISVEWEDEQGDQESNIEQSVPADMGINPVECLDSEEKFAKSSLKEIGNLFCSFDE